MTDGIGVILINLGTPDQAHPTAVRRYLAEFLSDRRVVEIPQILWQPILRGLTLTTRPKRDWKAIRTCRPSAPPGKRAVFWLWQ